MMVLKVKIKGNTLEHLAQDGAGGFPPKFDIMIGRCQYFRYNIPRYVRASNGGLEGVDIYSPV